MGGQKVEYIDMRIEDMLTERQRDIQTETLIKREVVKGRRGQVTNIANHIHA